MKSYLNLEIKTGGMLGFGDMKKIAIISRELYMNGVTKALVEMLQRVNYEIMSIVRKSTL